MSIPLDTRITASQEILEELDSVLGRHPGKLPSSFRYLEGVTSQKNALENWMATLEARGEVFSNLQGLEVNTDEQGVLVCVPTKSEQGHRAWP